MIVSDLTITSVETLTGFDINTGAYLFTLDEPQSVTISQAQDSTEITGKGGRKLGTIKRNKTVTIEGSNGLISGGLLEMQTGSPFENKETEVLWVDYLTVNSQKASTSWKAVGTKGNEIETVYVRNSDGTLGAKLEQDAEATSGKFTYDPATKELNFAEDIADKTEIVVYYKRKITAGVLENSSDTFSKKCILYIDALGEDKCGGIYRIQFFIPKADFSGEFSIEMGENPAVHNFTVEALSGACGTSGMFFTFTVFGVDTKDTENP